MRVLVYRDSHAHSRKPKAMLCNDGSDIASLARAAVDGDDKALDMFMWSKDTAVSPAKLSHALYKKEACTFYIASDDGNNAVSSYISG